jgi:hypothetical protein
VIIQPDRAGLVLRDARLDEIFHERLRATHAAYPAARLEVRQFETGPLIDAPIAIRIQALPYD